MILYTQTNKTKYYNQQVPEIFKKRVGINK